MAEFVMKHLVTQAGLANQFDIASCATSTEELGSDIHRGTRKKLTEMGIPFTSRSARQLTEKDYADYDYLIAMDHNNLRNIRFIIPEDAEHKIRLLLSFNGEDREIADPWYTRNFDQTYADIDRGCKALLCFLEKRQDQ